MSESAFASPEIITIGQAVVDCITRCRTSDPARPEVSTALGISLNVGGDAVNEALALTALGRRAGIVCAVGNDPAGLLLLSSLKNGGVDISNITQMESPFMTPVANIFVENDGSRSSVNSKATLLPGYMPDLGFLSAGMRVSDSPPASGCAESPSRIQVSGTSAPARPKVISLASLFRAPFDTPEKIRDIVSEAKKSGAVICADTKLPTFRTIQLSEIADILPMIDYIFPNEREAAFYSGYGPEAAGNRTDMIYSEIADVFLGYGVKHVVVKAGPDGCYAKDTGGFFHIPALPVKAVNTTGAGDHFVAGFISALLDGNGFRECCISGTGCAAEKIIR